MHYAFLNFPFHDRKAFRVLLHLDYNTDLNAETLASMQASGLLYTYLTDSSCTNVGERINDEILDDMVIVDAICDVCCLLRNLTSHVILCKYNITKVDCLPSFPFELAAELYALIEEDIQWEMQNDQGELDFANLAEYMERKVASQKEKSHLIFSHSKRVQNVNMILNKLLQLRLEFGSSLNLVGVTSSYSYGNPNEWLVQFNANMMTKVFEKDVDYPERWYLGISGVINILNADQPCERNFLVPVFSDQLFKIQLQVDHSPADGPEDAHACYVFKQLLFTASSTASSTDRSRSICFVRKIAQRGINTLHVELSVQINRSLLQSHDNTDLHLRELLAVPNNRPEIVISHFTTMPTYGRSTVFPGYTYYADGLQTTRYEMFSIATVINTVCV
ncbi:hypothetical protein AHF37_08005 [Paragonimus kellicotti]|nr:hypothetical protein AHF37_08005 [Paragonimus kellicotti]